MSATIYRGINFAAKSVSDVTLDRPACDDAPTPPPALQNNKRNLTNPDIRCLQDAAALFGRQAEALGVLADNTADPCLRNNFIDLALLQAEQAFILRQAANDALKSQRSTGSSAS